MVASNPPYGWTVDDKEMDMDYYWSDNGPGVQAAASAGLTELSKLQPQMIRSSEHGGGAYLFTYDGKVYLWNMIQDDVYLYSDPADLEGVLREMRKQSGKVTRELVLVEEAEE
ncbi:uncharacterized protein T069G_11211 [Trichoderma breve]|uniref:Uncharacterized protein n=1 Tax=Trichoderma breve TaxID=2034170 RepID=A0A9W9B2A4_9HYPO|nr:uncharacterized protein T069G_11211 [Trichoderma breve]KAJ4854232.1 hypothetical protein T069G_11211 [Trichoderma breve]